MSENLRNYVKAVYSFDHVLKSDRVGTQHDLDRYAARGSTGFAHGALDLLLRGDPDLFEKLSQRHVELVVVHFEPPCVVYEDRGRCVIRHRAEG